MTLTFFFKINIPIKQNLLHDFSLFQLCDPKCGGYCLSSYHHRLLNKQLEDVMRKWWYYWIRICPELRAIKTKVLFLQFHYYLFSVWNFFATVSKHPWCTLLSNGDQIQKIHFTAKNVTTVVEKGYFGVRCNVFHF